MLLGPKDINFRSYIFVEYDLKHVAFPVLTSYVMIMLVGGSSGEDENGNELE
jgi:hypothetical protein